MPSKLAASAKLVDSCFGWGMLHGSLENTGLQEIKDEFTMPSKLFFSQFTMPCKLAASAKLVESCFGWGILHGSLENIVEHLFFFGTMYDL